MFTFIIGLSLGLFLSMFAAYLMYREAKKRHEQQILLYSRELGSCITEEDFEKLAHAVHALKEFDKCGIIDHDNFPGFHDIMNEADDVIMQNKLRPLWY